MEIVPYNPVWQEEFARLKAMVLEYTGDLIQGVEHVGSTSVEGLAAKAIIDLDIVIERYDILPAVVERLQEAGYEHEGDLGIEGREAFRKTTVDNYMKHHLYVCPEGGRAYREHIALRNYLRQNKAARDEYSALKRKLAEKYRYDVDTYCENKTDFITGILKKTLYQDESFNRETDDKSK